MNRLMSAFFMLFFTLGMLSQRPAYYKLSPTLRKLASAEWHAGTKRIGKAEHSSRSVCAFIKFSDDAQTLLATYHCQPLARIGDIYIAFIPIEKIGSLSHDSRVQRIEAEGGNRLTMDSTGFHVNALPVYMGTSLPQAYTGKGVVMGIMDVGFDLTHPNFYDSTTTEYRIKSFWDQLSADTIRGELPVGAAYTTKEALLNYAHSRDGFIQTHGTHTLGIAAGSGYNSSYRGIAYESDICLVSNAVVQDTVFIAPENIDKYTTAMDVLGFKYIFDYAESVGKPCVISFSEGSYQDFYGEDILFYEALEALTGPGKILVASAGNEGYKKTYFKKERGEERKGAFLSSSDRQTFTLKSGSEDSFELCFTVYGQTQETERITISTNQVIATDSDYIDTLDLHAGRFVVNVTAYRSGYTDKDVCYDVSILAPMAIGSLLPVSFEVVGADAEIEWYRGSGNLVTNALNSALDAGEYTHNILSPGSAPCVICVGATSYRTAFVNYLGNQRISNKGVNGQRGEYSSVGPTFDGRIKPDVMAPGTNVISSYSSFYLEQNPTASDINSDVAHFDYEGRTYAWNSNTGTSMSSPVVGGAVALWLQANPSLTPQDIIGVLSRTCSHYDSSLTYPNNTWGYGQIDVYRGLLDILGIDGVSTISHSQTQAQVFVSGQDLFLRLEKDTKEPLTVYLYALSGAALSTFNLHAGCREYRLPLSKVPSGVFVIQIDGEQMVRGSSLVRKP